MAEFLVVQVVGREDDQVDVLVWGKKRGKTGQPIILSESGIYEISVDLAGAKMQTVEVKFTTAGSPCKVAIQVGEDV